MRTDRQEWQPERARVTLPPDPAEHVYRRTVEQYAQHYEIAVSCILGTVRTRTVALARHHVWFDLAERGFSPEEISRAAGVHRTTITEGMESFARTAGLVGWRECSR